jgi:PncC family amidohydrolase
MTKELALLANRLLGRCREKKLKLAMAESCTGGLVSALLTEEAGGSDMFMGGAVTYSNEAKRDILGVSQESLDKFGAVSAQVAEEMALGACRVYAAQISASVTGIAGPSGGSPEKPVGTVYIACALQGKVTHRHFLFIGNRQEIRLQSAEAALNLCMEKLK